MTAEMVRVPFNGDVIDAAQDGARVLVSPKRICENLGLTYQPQHRKLTSASWACVTEMVMQVPGDSQARAYTMIDLDTLLMWLTTLNEARVTNKEARKKVVEYQANVKGVLSKHFGLTGEPQLSPVLDRVLTVLDGVSRQLSHFGERLTTLEHHRPASHSPGLMATFPTTHARARAEVRGWPTVTAAEVDRIKRLAVQRLRRMGDAAYYGDSATAALVFLPHQLAVLDGAINDVMEASRQAEERIESTLFGSVNQK